MKKHFFLLGLLVLLIGNTVPAMADPDPGGVSTQTAISLDSNVPTIAMVDAVTTEVIFAALAIVSVLFLLVVHRRALSIPWAVSFWKILDAVRLKVRRTFDKLTVSPVLKCQSAV